MISLNEGDTIYSDVIIISKTAKYKKKPEAINLIKIIYDWFIAFFVLF